MKYYKANEVISPKEFIDIVEILEYGDENSYALAIIDWEGEHQLGIRWNIARREWDDKQKKDEEKVCVGMPSSRGYPVWFIIPNSFINHFIHNDNEELIKKITQFIHID
ncbi:MAG TPA: hypothetical protein PLM70_10010 [Bacteroidales bacterium]|nr:hypothetical protein [Bacteroidales bacterium]